MTQSLFDFTNSNILVIGNTVLDAYWYGDTSRISPEAPVPVTHHKYTEYRLSGAGLIAANIKSLGSGVNLISTIGENSIDEDKNQKLLNLLTESKLETHNILHIADKTNQRVRLVSQAQQLLKIDRSGSKANIDNSQGLEILDKKINSTLNNNYDTAVFYDDGSNIINNTYLNTWLEICKKNQVKTVYIADYKNSLQVLNSLENKPDYIFDAIDDMESGSKDYGLGQSVSGLFCVNKIKGINYRSKESSDIIEDNDFSDNKNTSVENKTGVEEVVSALIALGISNNSLNSNILDFIKIINSGINYTEHHFGQVILNIAELELAYSTYILKTQFNSKLFLQQLKQARDNQQKVVFANGCFDVLHAGHVAYLEAAKKQGDKLIVCINSDCSTKRLKGESRPINNLSDRMFVLTHLDFIDWVVPFYTDTPEDFLRYIKPDILVKGNDYTIDQVVGREIVYAYGGEVKIIEVEHPGKSSSRIIESKILEKDHV